MRANFLIVATLVLWSCGNGDLNKRKRHTPAQDARITRLLGAFPTPGTELHEPDGKRCPGAMLATNQASVDSICAMVVPRSGRLWFEGPNGEPCWCGCDALLEFNQGLRDTLHELRISDDLKEYQKRASSLTPPPGPKKSAKLSKPMPPPPPISDEAMPVDSMAPEATSTGCDRTAWQIEFGGRCVTIDDLVDTLFSEFPVFVFDPSVDMEADWPYSNDYDHITDWAPGMRRVERSSRMWFVVPVKFFTNAEVGGELALYIMAHEIGHGLANGFVCRESDDVPLVCEGECDYWAVSVGLRALFDDPQYVAVAKAARAQMEAYSVDLYHEEAMCGYYFCECDDHACGYPTTECRKRIITNAIAVPGRRSNCIENWPAMEPPTCVGDTCP